MSLDKLAVIFIIIILPISVVLSAYTNNQTETLKLQISYDQKLSNATTDAIKAYQLNAFNETTSDLATMKVKDIRAAANAFFNSVATNFGMTGYSKDYIEDYVPALVFTMYDGYYLYSRYTNTLTEEEYKTEANSLTGKASTYQGGERREGLRPFVSYSCRYKDGDDYDFTISYTLDNFISIQGVVDGNWVNDSGYLIDINQTTINQNTINNKDTITYRGKIIKKESASKEKVGQGEYICQKVNGVKYYYDPDHKDSRNMNDPRWFTIFNGTKKYENRKFNMLFDYSAYNYYKDAYNFTQKLVNTYHLGDLNTDKAVDENGDKLDISQSMNIFDIDGIEEKTSNFNDHRLAVIKYTIEKNLSIAIKNYNHFSNVEADFQMPKLNENEWDKILNNMTLISFLQGLPIGGKIYNGCCVVANNKNDEVVSEESIYIALGQNYYRPTYTNFSNIINNTGEHPIGIFNVDLERRVIDSEDVSIEPDYYYPKEYYADYESIVSPTKNANIYATETNRSKDMYMYNGNIYKYLDDDAEDEVTTAYYTALGRERYSTYKVNRTYSIDGNAQSYNIPEGSKLFECNNHTYAVINNKMTWHQAEAYCESLGGHLITINNDNEQNELEEYLSGESENRFWIGATDEIEEGKWLWITGENSEHLGEKGITSSDDDDSWAFRNWGGGILGTQPDNHSEIQHYAFLQKNTNLNWMTKAYCWDDDSVEKEYCFICEWE